MPSRSKTLAGVGTGCTLLALAAWLFYVRAFSGVHGDDWMVFYTAARMPLEHTLSIVYDGTKLTALLNARFAHDLAHPLILHPFLYPPHYLLVLAPFGLLSPLASGILFLVASFAALVLALSLASETNEEWLILSLAAILCPAAAIVVCAGQNTFLTLALLIGGLGLAGRRPILAGILLGLLTCKPQLWLMAPVALLACRQWKALFATAATAFALIVLSVAVFGIHPWLDWFHVMTTPSALYTRWNDETRVNGLSVYNYVSFLGAPERLANLAQMVAIAACACLVYWTHRKPMPRELRLAVVLAATMLASPHILLYDAMTTEVAASLFFVYALRKGTPVVDTVISVPVWLITLVNPPTLFAVGEITPFLIVAFLVLVIRRGRETGERASRAGMAFSAV
jgi:hypothetical protein